MNRIAELRKQHGYSQAELAERLSIAQNTLSQYETSKRVPAIKTINVLSNIFKATPNYILGLPEPQKEEVGKIFNITNATIIRKTSSESEVNMCLKLGWKLLFVGQYATSDDNGIVDTAFTEYTIGWFGKSDETIDEPLDETEGLTWW